MHRIDRRCFVTGALAAGGLVAGADSLRTPDTAVAKSAPIGHGGHPMGPPDLAGVADRIGTGGDPLALVDLNIVELDEPLSKAVKP